MIKISVYTKSYVIYIYTCIYLPKVSVISDASNLEVKSTSEETGLLFAQGATFVMGSPPSAKQMDTSKESCKPSPSISSKSALEQQNKNIT